MLEFGFTLENISVLDDFFNISIHLVLLDLA